MSYSNIASKKDNERVYARLQSKLSAGAQEQVRVINRVTQTVIRDKLVPPAAMSFVVDDGALKINYPGETCTIHRHALNQLAAKVGIPMTYVSSLHDTKEEWKQELLSHNLHELFTRMVFPDRNGSPRFLHRIVGNQLRGFLSRRFNRHLASAPLLVSFLETCTEVGAAPAEAIMTDVRVGMRCYLPLIFEPVPGEYIALGVEWANSDFGAGKLAVSACMWLSVVGHTAVLDRAISRVHIGSVIDDADIEMSEDTYAKEAETQAMAVADAVRNQLSVENVERLCDAIARAREEEIPWGKLRGQLARFLTKKEVDWIHQGLEDEVMDLPPVGRDAQGKPVANAYWAMAAVSRLASRVEDADRKQDLERAAGTLLGVTSE